MASGGNEYFDQFIEDYYAECDEHLASARRVVLELESAAGGASVPALHELHRSLHTLKGLSGMVGDQSVEQVAHALEDALRGAARSGLATSDARFVDALFSGIDALERCVAAHRAGEPPPDVAVLVAALGEPSERAQPTARAPGRAAPVAPVVDGGGDAVLYRFEFMPSVDLSARGVGVDAIRTRLRALGTMLDARPRVVGGGVVFDFTVAVRGTERPDDAWTKDGLRWTVEERVESEDDPAAGTKSTATPSTPASLAASSIASSGMVRVELSRLDEVMRLVGDVVVCRSRLDDALRNAARTDPAALLDELAATNDAMERQLRQLREGVMRIRLVPVGEVFERLRFSARDAIRESGKQVRLVFHGQTTEIDKVVVDRMLEPLLHLVRNAVTHGIEAPAERLRLGKPPEGTLTLRAAASGDRIFIVVEDDGRGIDVGDVEQRARAHGLLGPDESLDRMRLLDVLCAPGFSTRDEADRTSGRGVGMDVVRAAVQALSGELAVESEAERGTKFTIELPLTLMILDALLVDVGGQEMAVPQPALREVLRIETSDLVTFENNDVVRYRDGVLPIVSLARLFSFPEVPSTASYVLVVGSEAAPMGLRVDRLIGLREIVMHPVPDPLVAMPGVAGATDLGNGRVSLILDAVAVLRLADEAREARAAARPILPTARPTRRELR